jgi:tight adherence protein C
MAEMFSGPNLLPVLLALAGFVVFLIIWFGLIEDNSTERRIKMLERRRSDLRTEMMGAKTKNRDAAEMAKGVVEKFKLLPDAKDKSATSDLAHAGFRSRDAIFIFTFIRLVAPILGWAGGFFAFYVLRLWDTSGNNLLMATLMCGIIVGLLPAMVLSRMTKNRMRRLSRALPDGLDLFVICAEAGLSLDATFDRVSTELSDAHPDLSDEFGITAVELGFMPERSKALQNFSARCPLPGARSLVSTLIQTERYGTPLAVSMRVLSAEMRNERIMKAEEKAARLPAVMTVPMILFILPPLFIVLIGPAVLRTQDAFK